MADPLSAAASIVALLQLSATVLKYLRDVKDASADCKSLIREMNTTHGILLTLQETVEDAKTSSGTWSTTIRTLGSHHGPLTQLKETLLQLATVLQTSASATGVKKAIAALRWPFKEHEVEKFLRIIERQKSAICLALENDHIALSQAIIDNTESIKDDITELTRAFSAAQVKIETNNENTNLRNLPCANDAAFNSRDHDHDPQCLHDTRVQLLDQIMTWTDASDGPCLFWLNGMAGTGKSTIARTIARTLSDKKRLGASFFFSQGQGDRGHATKFFTTLAAQLAYSLPALKPYICAALDAEYNIPEQGLSEQWNKLILEPLSKLKNTADRPPPTVIVIDALDECKKDSVKDDVRFILQLLAQVQGLKTVQLRVFVTSRPESSIRQGFKEMPESTHQDCILHNIDQSIIQHDISVFFKHELGNAAKARNLSAGWPSEEKIQLLVQAADGLFIYAATVCRFIGRLSPEKRLDLVLQKMSTSTFTSRSTRKLDEMYTQILKSALNEGYDEEDQEELVELFVQILGSFVILEDTLSSSAMAQLLGLLKAEVDELLNYLRAVLDVPDSSHSPVQLLHPSFRDFLLDKQRCIEHQFWVDEKAAHSRLVETCLRLMHEKLKKDICGLKRPGYLLIDLERSRIDECLSPALQYACCYWIHHFEHSDIVLKENSQLQQFLEEHLLHLLEAFSLMGKMTEGVIMITTLRTLVEASGLPQLVDFVEDSRRFILYNRSIIEKAPLQVYVSGLVFSPKSSLVRQRFLKQELSWVHLILAVDNDWSSSLQTLEDHTSWVTSVAFSPNNLQLVSASYDCTARIWDARTGGLQKTLEGHTDTVRSVAYSPLGTQVASAAYDQTIRLWDPRTGFLLRTLEAEGSGWATFVTFSHDGKSLASTHGDSKVRLWDADTGELIRTFTGHTQVTWSVSFSPPNAEQLASVSDDLTIRLWETSTGKTIKILEGHTAGLRSVVFSPDGKQLASAARDNTVRLWDANSGDLQDTLEGHAEGVWCVTFSPDGKHLASSSRDRTVRIWDATTGASLKILDGHTEGIWIVAYSPNGRQLATACRDRTIKIWDANVNSDQSTTQKPLENPAEGIRSLAFSPCGTQLASASRDNNIRLWEASSGALQKVLTGHTLGVWSVAFAPSGQHLASASNDLTVRIWNATTGAQERVLEGHSGCVWSVAFSPDGKRLASASSDHTVRLWDTSTWAVKCMLKGHTDWISSIKFSSTGMQLASVSYDRTLKIWNVDTGLLDSTINHSADTVISFTHHNKCVLTDAGQIELEPITPNSIDTSQAYSLVMANSWIAYKGENVIWLPPQYRQVCQHFRDNIFAFGSSSGRVTVISIYPYDGTRL